jgi:hypothetical protein
VSCMAWGVAALRGSLPCRDVSSQVGDEDQGANFRALDLDRARPSDGCRRIIVGGVGLERRVVGPVYGALLLAVRLHQVYGLGRHNRGNGVLVDEL